HLQLSRLLGHEVASGEFPATKLMLAKSDSMQELLHRFPACTRECPLLLRMRSRWSSVPTKSSGHQSASVSRPSPGTRSVRPRLQPEKCLLRSWRNVIWPARLGIAATSGGRVRPCLTAPPRAFILSA